ncbi:hypothetical protein [Alicyclobacillus sp. SO9]|uniref:hypothetical protein n=1 Tax=Alicyclobacillus sp. SO9 TaxID=2665646 RepID=UPI0018E7B847|nr:hypothetical protein [Alicyclobacillus sp. SO9]QQE81516.1 hypothetical protein GI364_15240 [Alicyclobacillus sp. SO9]
MSTKENLYPAIICAYLKAENEGSLYHHTEDALPKYSLGNVVKELLQRLLRAVNATPGGTGYYF